MGQHEKGLAVKLSQCAGAETSLQQAWPLATACNILAACRAHDPLSRPAAMDQDENTQATKAIKAPQSSTIDIFLRVKPVPKPSSKLIVDLTDCKVEFNLPKDTTAG